MRFSSGSIISVVAIFCYMIDFNSPLLSFMRILATYLWLVFIWTYCILRIKNTIRHKNTIQYVKDKNIGRFQAIPDHLVNLDGILETLALIIQLFYKTIWVCSMSSEAQMVNTKWLANQFGNHLTLTIRMINV